MTSLRFHCALLVLSLMGQCAAGEETAREIGAQFDSQIRPLLESTASIATTPTR
jgi:hypothetical protein